MATLLELTTSSLCFVIHVLLECPTKGFTSSTRKYSLVLRPHERHIKKLYLFLFFIFVGSLFLFCAMLQDFKHLVCDAWDVYGLGGKAREGESGYGSRAEGCGDTYHLPHSGWSSLCFTTFLCVSLRKYFTQSNSVARKRKRPKSQRTLTAATRPRRQGRRCQQGWQWQWRRRRCQYRMYRTMAKADTGLNCRRCHFGGSLQPSDFFVVMHQHQHQNQHQHQHLRQHHLGSATATASRPKMKLYPRCYCNFEVAL